MASQREYLNFDLVIEQSGDIYRARVINSPCGQASVEFNEPFSKLELENFVLRMGQSRSGVRRIDTPEMQAAKGLGRHLFTTVFSGEVNSCYLRSVDQVRNQNRGLRVRLRINVPEFNNLPWEFLYDPQFDRFVSLSETTPIIRYMELPYTTRPLPVQAPLKILVMISSPEEYPELDVKREWETLNQALKPLLDRKSVVLEKLEHPTLGALQKTLRQDNVHIFHFIGHGKYFEDKQDGMLLLEDEKGRGRPTSGQYLGTILQDHYSLRLVVLNACEGARTSAEDPYAGVAQTLVRQGIPAVLAMQFVIFESAATVFAEEFYSAIVDNYPVDAALSEARKAIFTSNNDVEWGTPVLFMRTPDGVLFRPESAEERAARLEVESEEQERLNKEAAERVARQKAEKAAKEKAEREAAEKAAKEKAELLHPSLAISLSVKPQKIEVGDEAKWTATLRNDGDDNLHRVIVKHKQTTLDEAFDLAAGKGRRFTFNTIYFTKGKKTENVTATGIASNGQSVYDEASATANVDPSGQVTPKLIPTPATQAIIRAVKSKPSVLPRPDAFTIASPIHIEFVRVPAGKFLMGSDPTKDENADNNEQPQHRVTLSEFYIGKYPVTNEQYSAFVKAAKHREPEGWKKGKIPSGKENHPVVDVSWNDAVAFCQWLSRETGRAFRLPTEAEWEKAARGTDGRIFPWGNKWDRSRSNHFGENRGKVLKWIVNPSAVGPTPVGQYSPQGDSPYGAADMSGNVREWCADWYDKKEYRRRMKSAVKDPQGPKKGSSRVWRGGSFLDAWMIVRCACRGEQSPTDATLLGFRVVFVPSPFV